MPSCWQIEIHACPRAPSWQHRCPADPRNASALPPNDPRDVGSRVGSTALKSSWQRMFRWWQEARGGYMTVFRSGSSSFTFGCVT